MSKQAAASSGMTPKLRELAAQLCSAYASFVAIPNANYYAHPARDLGFNRAVEFLANKAIWMASSENVDRWIPPSELWAIACSMLRNGEVES